MKFILGVLSSLALLCSFVGAMFVLQLAGFGAEMLEKYPSLIIDDVSTAAKYTFVFLIADVLCSGMLNKLWSKISPIKSVTLIETLLVIILNWTIGIFLLTWLITRMAFADMAASIPWIMMALVLPALSISLDAVRAERAKQQDVDKDLVEMPEIRIEIRRVWLASIAAALTVWLSLMFIFGAAIFYYGAFDWRSIFAVAGLVFPVLVPLAFVGPKLVEFGLVIWMQRKGRLQGTRIETALSYSLAVGAFTLQMLVLGGIFIFLGGFDSFDGMAKKVLGSICMLPTLFLGGLVFAYVASPPDINLGNDPQISTVS